MTPFGDFIFAIRREWGLRQKEMAYRMGVDASYLCALEAGRREPPTAEQLQRYAQALGLSGEMTRKMVQVAELSRRRLEIPQDASKEEYVLAHQFMLALGSLTSAQVEIIRLLLQMPVAKSAPVSLGLPGQHSTQEMNM